MAKCIICDRRPAANERGWCATCTAQIEADQRRRSNGGEPVKYLHYRGNVVGLFPNGNGALEARLLPTKSLGRIPKKHTIDLDRYCEGYTREQVKRFKATILKLALV